LVFATARLSALADSHLTSPKRKHCYGPPPSLCTSYV